MEQILVKILDEMKQTNHRLGNLESGLNRLETRVSSLEQKVDTLDKRVGNLELGQARIETKLDDLTTEMRSHFKYVEGTFDQNQTVLKAVSGVSP